jgi:hypothetical protein
VGIADRRGESVGLNFPDGITLTANDEIVVTDTNNHAIRVVTPGGLCALSTVIPHRCIIVLVI